MYSIGAGIGPNKVKSLKFESLSLSLYETVFKRFISLPIKMIAIYLQYGGSNAFFLKKVHSHKIYLYYPKLYNLIKNY